MGEGAGGRGNGQKWRIGASFGGSKPSTGLLSCLVISSTRIAPIYRPMTDLPQPPVEIRSGQGTCCHRRPTTPLRPPPRPSRRRPAGPMPPTGRPLLAGARSLAGTTLPAASEAVAAHRDSLAGRLDPSGRRRRLAAIAERYRRDRQPWDPVQPLIRATIALPAITMSLFACTVSTWPSWTKVMSAARPDAVSICSTMAR